MKRSRSVMNEKQINIQYTRTGILGGQSKQIKQESYISEKRYLKNIIVQLIVLIDQHCEKPELK